MKALNPTSILTHMKLHKGHRLRLVHFNFYRSDSSLSAILNLLSLALFIMNYFFIPFRFTFKDRIEVHRYSFFSKIRHFF